MTPVVAFSLPAGIVFGRWRHSLYANIQFIRQLLKDSSQVELRVDCSAL